MRGNGLARPIGRSARRLAITLLTTGGLMAWGMTPAFAAVVCGFFVPPTVTVALSAGDTATIAVDGTAIEVNGAACGLATTANTDTIVVTGAAGFAQTVNIDLFGGDFAPGLAVEGAAPITSEIEFTIDLGDGDDTLNVWASDGDDAITFGTVPEVVASVGPPVVVAVPAKDYIALNDDLDADVTGPAGAGIAGVENYGDLDGLTGDDWLSAGGGQGTGSAFEWQDMVINGGLGRDTLTGGIGADTLDGGDGSDWLDGGDGDDDIDGGLTGDDTVSFASVSSGVNAEIDEGAGDASSADDDDTLSSIDNMTGSPFADRLLGDETTNTLRGGKGRDNVKGAGGADTVKGGRAADTLRGGDGDDDLFGNNGPDSLHGGSGADLCLGGKGADTVASCEL